MHEIKIARLTDELVVEMKFVHTVNYLTRKPPNSTRNLVMEQSYSLCSTSLLENLKTEISPLFRAKQFGPTTAKTLVQKMLEVL